jgi:hypothetical protein
MIIDERVTSWKILLPSDINLSVLLFNCSESTRTSLLRNYKRVDVTADLTKYDIIVIGSLKKVNSFELTGILDLLSNGGLIVFLNANKSRNYVKRNNLYSVVLIAALPKKSPRLYIPLENKKNIIAGISFHRPGSRKARILTSALKAFASLDIFKPLFSKQILITSKESVEITTDVLSLAKVELKIKAFTSVIYTGSDSIKRKITVLLSSEHNEKFVLKISDTNEGSAAIKKETINIKSFAETDIAYAIPKILFAGDIKGYHVQAQTFLSNQAKQQQNSITIPILSFLKKLAFVNSNFNLLSELPIWLHVKNNLTLLSKCNSAIDLYNWLLSKEETSLVVPTHASHGDFAPWNMQVTKDDLKIYDWEDSSFNEIAAKDLFHFIFRQSHLIGPWKGAKFILTQYELVYNKVYPHYPQFGTICLSLSALNEYLSHPNSHIIEVIDLLYSKKESLLCFFESGK